MMPYKLTKRIEKVGDCLVEGFHLFALFIIGATIVWSAASQYLGMMEHGRATLQEILVLFIYLELGAMVGIYFKTNRLPVRYLLYIGITALTRSLMVDVEASKIHILLVVTGAILMLALAIVVLRYGTGKFVDDDIDVRDKRVNID